ncbi:hypothetical protein [Apilactobacillus timberlakei]|uniref:hypothetical protein n=1 Tax=Apilactobacillus timberlakei TaxID=2008380 RepID=UPI00112A78F3|nr:hypothetical protein [Apilactobacillus timberlakei]
MSSTINCLRGKGYHFHIDEQAKYWNDNIPAISYAKNIGFFKSFGINKGKKFIWQNYLNDIKEKEKTNFCPILTISWEDLYNSGDYHYGIVSCSKKLARVLSADIGEEETKTIVYLIREMLRNPFEHSTAKKVLISAQRHNADGYIEVVIADSAEGLKQTLSVNKDIISVLNNDSDALEYALKPGISGTDTKKKGYWSNSGYGLYVTSRIADELGSFFIISGEYALKLENGEKNLIHTKYQGTAVCLKFDIDKVESMNSSLISDVVSQGEKIASDIPESSKIASKASKIIDI